MYGADNPLFLSRRSENDNTPEPIDQAIINQSMGPCSLNLDSEEVDHKPIRINPIRMKPVP